MRFEKPNSSNNKKWFQLDIVPWKDGKWALLASSGVPNQKGEDEVMHPLHEEFSGTYDQVFDVFDAKVKRLLSQGYKKVEIDDKPKIQ